MTQFKVEVGVLHATGETVWPAEYQAKASADKLQEVIAVLLEQARVRTVTGIRTTKLKKEIE